MTKSGNKRRVLALGECMVELRQAGERSLTMGYAGDTLNSTVYLRRLLPVDQFEVGYVTALGDDRLSGEMLAEWEAEGVETGLVRRLAGQLPGLYWICTDEHGERSFRYWRNASAARQVLADGYCSAIKATLNEGDLLFASGISFAILSPEHRDELLALFEELRSKGVVVAFDSNFRASLWSSKEEVRAIHERILSTIDILITSHEDEAAMFGDADIVATVQRIDAMQVPETVIRGAPGVTITRAEGELTATPIKRELVVDTTGAGDSFDAGFIAARLTGSSMAKAIGVGHALAAVVVQHKGAIIPSTVTPGLADLRGNSE